MSDRVEGAEGTEGAEAARALDLAVLAKLRQLNQPGEPDLVQEVLGLFVADAQERLVALAAAEATHDPEALQRAAHALKGGAANIGAHQLESHCRDLEEMGRAGETAGATARIAAIREEFARIKTEIAQLL
jgi:HPt (histidine-containing phosphotransfer) domain-containing protein